MRRTLPILIAPILLGSIAATSAFSQSLTVFSGNGQVVLEQFLTSSPLTVAAIDAQGNPITGLPITWSTSQGAGTIVNPKAMTDSNGYATANFLGTDVPGGLSYTQATVTASSSIGSASFYVTTTVLRLQGGGTGALPLLELVSPAASNRTLSGAAGSVLPGAVKVRMSIQSGPQVGTLLPNIGVRIYNYNDPGSTPSGVCRGGTVLTDATGVATCDLVLNNNLGEGQLSAIAGDAEITPSFILTITPGTPCTYALTPQGQSFSGAGGTGMVSLTTANGCPWAAASNASWVVLTGYVAGSGNSNLGFAVATNSGPARTAAITVGSQVFTISQAAAGASTPLTILTSSPLTGGSASSPYSLQFQVTGGTPPYRWTGSSLPNGLTMSTSGLLSGAPTSAGTYTSSVTVTDAMGVVATQSYTLTVSSAPSTTNPQITNSSFAGGSVGQAYKQAVTFTTSCTSPFSPPPTITVASGGLPPGLTLTSPVAESWLITGSPTTAGAFTFTLTITEVCGRTASGTYTLVIGGSGGTTGGGGGGTGGQSGAILTNPQAVSFTVGAGTAIAPPAALINVSSSTGSPVSYTASVINGTGGVWLFVSGGASGTTPASVTLSLGGFQNLPATSYTAQLAISSVGNPTVFVPVTLNVSSAPPVTVTPAALVFTTPVLQAPASLQQIVQVASATSVHFNAGFGTDSQANWLGVTPGAGDTPTQMTIVVNPVGLGPGTYTGHVLIAPAGGVPVTVPVTLVVTTPPVLSWSLPSVNASYVTGGPTPPDVTVNLASSSSAINFLVTVPQDAGWLSVTPNTGTTPANITFTFDPTGLTPGVYQAIVTANSVGTSTQPVTIPVSFAVQQAAPTISAILNGASYLPGALAPGLEVQIVGAGLGPVTQADAVPDDNGLFETSLAGATVLFNGTAAPVLHASDGAITVLVPYEVAGLDSVTVIAEYRFAQSAPQDFVVSDANPGLFTAAGSQAVILNEDGTYNGSTNGANPGSVIGILGTGEGQTNPPGIDGLIMQTGALASPLDAVTVQINGEPATLVSATSAPGQPAGVFLIQVQVPGDIQPGSTVPVSVTIGSATSQAGVTMVVAQPQAPPPQQ
ncbi:MAG TPA: putative Ig domain-containing protein [Bryobacteraceae bacterium]